MSQTTDKVCAKCSGKLATAGFLSNDTSLEKRPVTGIFSRKYSPLHAYVCQECGYVELYVNHPEYFRDDD